MKLLGQTVLGNLTLKNRMVMSAMTRSSAGINGIVGDMTVRYYSQRAGAGIIVTEAIRISEEATGSPFLPGSIQMAKLMRGRKLQKPFMIMGLNRCSAMAYRPCRTFN